MKRPLILALLSVTVCITSAAQGTPIVCYDGTEAGGGGARKYTYTVDSDKEKPLMEFMVSTGDLDINNYTHILIPDGWRFNVGSLGNNLSCYGSCSDMGDTALLLRHVTDQCVVWSADDAKYAVESFTFGFDHAWDAHDAAWCVVTNEKESNTYMENPTSPVGLGSGPVHGPFLVPEPTTLSLLVVSGLSLLLLLKQRRK